MEQVNVIKLNFYVPMYGTGCFVCEKIFHKMLRL